MVTVTNGRGGWLRQAGTTRVYLAIWLAALIFAITAPLALLIIAPPDRAPMWTPYGVTGGFRGNVIWEVYGPEARAAGVRPLDLVVSIDGVAVEGVGLRRTRELLKRRPRETVALSIRRGDGTVTAARLPWRAANLAAGEGTRGGLWERRPWWIVVPMITGMYLWVFAAILLFRRRRDPMAALFSISFLLFACSYVSTERLFYEFGLYNLQLVLAFAATSLLAFGILIFPSGRFEPRWTKWAALLIPVYALGGFVFSAWNGAVVAAFFVLQLIALAAILQRYRGATADTERQQIRWLLLGLAASAIFVLCQSLVRYAFEMSASAPAWTGFLPMIFSVAASAAFLGGLVVSLLKYRLYDANAVVERSVTFGILTLGLLAVFAGSEKVIEVLGEDYFGERLGALAGGLAAALAAVLIVPLHHRITHWAENRFQKDLRRLGSDLPLIVGHLRETSTVDTIAGVVLDEIAAGLRDHHAAILLSDQVVASRGIGEVEIADWRRGWVTPSQGGVERDRDDPIFPLRLPLGVSGHERVGWLLIGPRPDGSFYGKDEQKALAELTDPIARALSIARERADEKEKTEQLLGQIMARLAVLENRLKAEQA